MLKSKVIRFITEKDTFERYIIRRIRLIWAKRLLHNRSISDDVERGMVAKLKVECGLQSTVKLEGICCYLLSPCKHTVTIEVELQYVCPICYPHSG